jgi:hypothetical protein
MFVTLGVLSPVFARLSANFTHRFAFNFPSHFFDPAFFFSFFAKVFDTEKPRLTEAFTIFTSGFKA